MEAEATFAVSFFPPLLPHQLQLPSSHVSFPPLSHLPNTWCPPPPPLLQVQALLLSSRGGLVVSAASAIFSPTSIPSDSVLGCCLNAHPLHCCLSCSPCPSARDESQLGLRCRRGWLPPPQTSSPSSFSPETSHQGHSPAGIVVTKK